LAQFSTSSQLFTGLDNGSIVTPLAIHEVMEANEEAIYVGLDGPKMILAFIVLVPDSTTSSRTVTKTIALMVNIFKIRLSRNDLSEYLITNKTKISDSDED
jgi:hypothetical protein